MKAFIFDMDGTLLNSEIWITRSPEIWVQEDLGKTISDELMVQLQPKRRTGRLRLLMAAGLADGYTEKEALDCANTVMERLYRTRVEMKPMVRETLEELTGRGIPCCVATMSRQKTTDDALEYFGLKKYFLEIRSGAETPVDKRNPSFFLSMAERLGAAPDEVTVVEDSLYAVKVALACGMHPWGVYDTVEGIHREEMLGLCEKYFDDFSDLYRAVCDMPGK